MRFSAIPLLVAVSVAVSADGIPAQGRPDVSGAEAAVVAGHPLAAQAGADVLRRGGNAVDAAITMAAVLSVVRPHMNGVGGDAFLLLRDARNGRVYALNGSGRAGTLATPALFREQGLHRVPSTGMLSVTVPGAVRAWSDALRRFGTLTLAEALEPAIRYAESGFPVSSVLAEDIAAEREKVEADPGLRHIFLPNGAVPAVGSILRQPELARTLRSIATEGADAVYVGEVGLGIARFMEAEGGLVRIEDLADHASTWQEPIWTTYAGYRVGAFPPNSQGVALLMQMNMAEQYDLKTMGHNDGRYIHTLVETKKLAFRERDRFVTDPTFSEIPLDMLTSKAYAKKLLSEFANPAAQNEPFPRADGGGDTVFLCAVDRQGNAVAMIESLFSAFGSGRMVPGTGIILQNRGSLFSLDSADANVIAPHKRTYHTLSPGIALRPDGSLFMVFGTPGGDGQTQTMLQVFNNIALFGMTPQRAVESPRWRSFESGRLLVEPGIPESVRAALTALGHDVRVSDGPTSEMGGAQVIMLMSGSGVRMTGADPRREAYGLAW